MIDDIDDDHDDADEDRIGKLFDKHAESNVDYNFDGIPPQDRRHPRPDVCALIYLHERFGGKGDAIVHAEHDQVWLDWEEDDLATITDADVIYLLRCGVHWDGCDGMLYFFR